MVSLRGEPPWISQNAAVDDIANPGTSPARALGHCLRQVKFTHPLLQLAPGPVPLNYLDLPTKAPDGPQGRILLPILQHVIQLLQRATRTAVESHVSHR